MKTSGVMGAQQGGEHTFSVYLRKGIGNASGLNVTLKEGGLDPVYSLF